MKEIGRVRLDKFVQGEAAIPFSAGKSLDDLQFEKSIFMRQI